MIGIVKVAALGAVMSCGALAVYDGPDGPREPVRASVEQVAPPSGRTVRRAKVADPAPETAACKPVRRRYWVEAEGWVLRSRCAV